MKRAREILERLEELGCVKLRQTGSHVIMKCGTCQAPVPVHPSYEIPNWLVYKIQQELAPCLGKGWLLKR
jgi:predicted RNA binding protein YcfA (HicA-like mRNA interferase family)